MFFKTYKNASISIGEYQQAVLNLLHLEKTGGSNSSRTAAQVLLSTYNGFDFQMDLTDLCYLDQSFYEAAITVIRARVETLREPHEVIQDGSAIFRGLWKRWKDTEIYRTSNQLD